MDPNPIQLGVLKKEEIWGYPKRLEAARAQTKGHVRTQNVRIYKPRREDSGGTLPANTWIPGF